MILNKSKFLDEKIYKKPLCSNAKCYIIPKCGFKTKEAVIAVKYGSKDLNFDNIGYTPSGTAHFIEHKLFEEEWGDVFEKFTKAELMQMLSQILTKQPIIFHVQIILKKI